VKKILFLVPKLLERIVPPGDFGVVWNAFSLWDAAVCRRPYTFCDLGNLAVKATNEILVHFVLKLSQFAKSVL